MLRYYLYFDTVINRIIIIRAFHHRYHNSPPPDSDKDGVLSEDDVVRFLCDVHSLHAGAGSSHAD
jgi:hypothetical protein